MTFQWACSKPTPISPSGTIPYSVLMPSPAPVPVTSVPGSGLWVVGAVVGDVTTVSGTSVTLGFLR